MKKKFKIIIPLIIFALLVITLSFKESSNTKKTFKKDGILYAVTLDGKVVKTFPSKGLYKAKVTCTNATGKWLYDDWKLSIESITGDVTCDVDFTTVEKDYFNSYITKLANTEQGNGKVVYEKGYRYEGKNPNNYVWFNNEYWRIIGVFDSDSHGQTGKNLVKLIRAETLGALAWDGGNTNTWSSATLNKILNGAYYNATTDTTNCFAYSTSTYGNCNYTDRGIKSSYRSMITKVNWYLGGYSSYAVIPLSIYKSERTTTYENNYIGLMYLSDYAYAVLATDCARTTSLKTYKDNASCAGKNWMYGFGDEYTISPYSSDSKSVIQLGTSGIGYDNKANYGANFRPVLYLNESVYVVDGDGSYANPYILEM